MIVARLGKMGPARFDQLAGRLADVLGEMADPRPAPELESAFSELLVAHLRRHDRHELEADEALLIEVEAELEAKEDRDSS